MTLFDQLGLLFSEAKGLRPFEPNGSGQVEGWPPEMMGRVSETLSGLAHGSTEELLMAIIRIEKAKDEDLPIGLITILERAAWDAPAAPDPVRVTRAVRNGQTLQQALGVDPRE